MPLVVLAAAAVALGAVVAVVALTRDSDSGTEALAPTPPPGLLTATELRDRTREARTPAYWVGAAPDTWYELTRRSDGSTLVRYVPRGTSADSSAPQRTVVTYPGPDGFADVLAATRRKDAVAFELPNGGIAMWDRTRPTNVFVAFPGVAAQIEVFDPRQGAARRVVTRGRVGPVTPASSAAARPFAATEDELARFAASVPGPVYWAGPRAGVRYEVTRTDDGTVYVRYLPAGVEPGDPRTGLLTVATYPHVNALEDVQAAAERPGAVSIPMELGAAVHDADSSGNVHLAFPDEDVQIEVYGADSDDVAALVRGGRIDAVR